MTPSQWDRIKTLFDEALQHAPGERNQFLDAACDDDPLVRREVEALLGAHERAEAAHALEGPFVRRDDPDAQVDEADQEGQRVGPYRLLQLLGRGGMGTVYRAERDDGQFRQTVALKLIRRGLDTDDILSRFVFERQILAGLDHPNIARLYDGGVTEDGRPYFAMEYVEGEPITEYCDRRQLSTSERLSVFRSVCRVVQYAHQNLVVHRDLKPSNILVTEPDRGAGAPSVKLLDFGIAKFLDEEGLADGVVPRTRTGMHVLTPEYAAPEQVQGGAITTATDVYQLGVLLYELLVGRRPYRWTSRVQQQIEQAILEEEPEQPSSAVVRTDAPDDEAGSTSSPEEVSRARSTDPGRLQRLLSGDLDTICLTALKKEQERRYASVEALSEDVRRHLEGLPVMARPDTVGYRVSRFVRRHRLPVVASVAVVMALVVGLGAALWQARRAAAERDRAEAALEQARGTLDYLGTTILSGGPYEGDPDTPFGQVLDSAAARVDADLVDAPVVAESVHRTFAKVYLERGLPDRADPHARRARELADRQTPAYARATTLLATALSDRGQYEEALPFHREAIERLRALDGEDADLGLALNGYGATLSYLNRMDEAEEAYLEALELLQTADAPEATSTLNNLAVLAVNLGRYDEGAERLRDLIARLRAEEHSLYFIGTSQVNLANALSRAGRMEAALEIYREGVATLAETLGSEHPEVLMARVTLANHLQSMGRRDFARNEAVPALATATASLGADHYVTAYAQNVAGRIYCTQGEAATGAPLLRASLETRRGMLPDGHWLVANGESLLGGCLARLGRIDEAEPLLRQGFETLHADRGPDHQLTVDARERLRTFYETSGRTPPDTDVAAE